MVDNLEKQAVDEVQKALEEGRQQAVKPAEEKPIESVEKLAPQDNVLSQLEQKKQEILEVEKRINEQKKAMDQQYTELTMAGKTLAGSAKKEDSKAEKLRKEAQHLLKGTDLDPFKGRGAGALEND